MPSSPVTSALSNRQRAALTALRAFQTRHGVPPTRAELGKALGVSAQTADFHLRALARKGALELRPLAARGLREPAQSPAARMVPLVGRVAAGSPQPALEHAEGAVPLPPGCRADFALRVEGDSMIEAGILPGDLVLVQQTRSAQTGEIVVALLGSGETTEATVKRFRTRGGRVILEPANRRLRPRTVDPDEEFALAGRVVGVLRWWK